MVESEMWFKSDSESMNGLDTSQKMHGSEILEIEDSVYTVQSSERFAPVHDLKVIKPSCQQH